MLRGNALKSLSNDLKTIGQIFPFFKSMRPLLLASFVLGLIASLIESAAVSIMVLFIFQTISGDSSFSDNSMLFYLFGTISEFTKGNYILIWAIIIGSIVLKSLITGIYTLLSAHVTNTIQHKIRSALFKKYLHLPFKDLAKLDYGVMTNALQVECWYISEAIRALSLIFIATCTICVYLGLIAALSWQLSALIIICGMITKGFSHLLYKPLKNIGIKVTEINEKLSLQMLTRMQSIKSIRSFGLEQKESDNFNKLSKKVAYAFTDMSKVEAFLRPIYDTSILLTIAVLIFASAHLGNEHVVTATIVAFMYRLQPHFYNLESGLMSIAKSQGPINAVIRQLNAQDITSELCENVNVPQNWQQLTCKNISFSYDDVEVLKNVNFTLSRGQTLHIQGDSGAGKSTMINLLLRLTTPSAGEIHLDNIPFQTLNRHDWLERIAACGQDFELLDGSLRENITLGRNIDEDLLQESLEIAQIKDFTRGLADGLNSKIGERGVRLSGGQRQRIIIARALCANPELLIMDEATSAVSYDVERAIYESLKTKRPQTTLIIITHRELEHGIADLSIKL